MEVAGKHLGTGHTFIVAEISASHEGTLDKAEYLITQAKQAGADAVKFQVYKPECLTVDSDHPAYKLTKGPWSGQTLWQLYEKGTFPWEWLPDLFSFARETGLVPFASPFSRECIDALEAVDCPAYKIASPEIVDLGLIRYAAETGKPLVMSTGMADMKEIGKAVGAADRCVLLHCVSDYPTDIQDANLRRMEDLCDRFGRMVGLSDHSRGFVAPIAAVALGAVIIEKHIMTDWPNDSLDRGFALEPSEFREFVAMVRCAELALRPKARDTEEASRQCRRRLVWVKDVKAGTLATEQNTRTARASEGLYPSMLGEVITAQHDAKAGDPVA